MARGTWAPVAQLPPATDAPVAVVHVDIRNPAANDANPGSEAAPLRSVAEAAERAVSNRRMGLATRVAIRPGIYRESVSLSAPAAAAAMPSIVFEGVGEGDVILSGSDIWAAWKGRAGSGLYRHAMPSSRGLARVPDGWDELGDELDPVVLRGEAVFVDGRLHRQVMSRWDLEAAPE